MPDLVLQNPAFVMDSYNLTPQVSALALNNGAELKDGTRSGDDTRRNVPGLLLWDLSHVGIQDFDSGNVDSVLFGNLGLTGKLVTVGPDGVDESDVVFFGEATEGEYQAYENAQIGELVKFTVAAASKSKLARGKVFKDASASPSADGDGTAIQLGAISAGQSLYAGIHVLDASGTTLDVTIESDDAMGFASPVVRGTFNQFTAVGSQWLTPVAGPITDDWWRASWDVVGGSFTFIVVAAIL